MISFLDSHVGKTTRARRCEKMVPACQIDCAHGHKITVDGERLRGTLSVKKCSSKHFAKNISRSHMITRKLSQLVSASLARQGLKLSPRISFVKVFGNKAQTRFQYICWAEKQHQQAITAALRAVCQDDEV
jgi:hypothetical protein